MNIDVISVIYLLPEYVFITENDDINVAVWDEQEKQWQTEQIGDLVYDKQARKLEFTTKKLAPLAYIQSRCTDYPFKSWKLRCIDNETAILDIETKRITLSFEIGAGYAKLIERNDSELKDIVNFKLSPGRLLLELSKCGIHLLPQDEDAKLGIYKQFEYF